MTDGTYLGPDYRFTRRRRIIEAFIWGEPEGYEAPKFRLADLIVPDLREVYGDKQFDLFKPISEYGEVYCPEEST